MDNIHFSPEQALRTDGPTSKFRYARGWHCLGLASDFKDGKPHGVDAFGTRLVVYQGESGQLHVLTAWCPHMGADLSIGQVRGETLVCKFHGWQWQGDGACAGIPYAKRIPPKARIQSWPSCEVNRFLFVWHDPEGGEPIAEQAIPPLPELDSGEWSGWHMAQWRIDNNCREVMDNVADAGHFVPVHGASRVVFFSNLFEGHRATQALVSGFVSMGKEAMFKSVATYYGPAYQITYLVGEFNGMLLEQILMNAHVPVSPNAFDLRYGVLLKRFPGLPADRGEAIIKTFAQMHHESFAKDMEMWHHKVRVDRPLLCDGDGPVMQNREWYAQFYQDVASLGTKLAQPCIVNHMTDWADPVPVTHVFESEFRPKGRPTGS